MHTTLKLETPQDFKKTIEFIAEQYFGWKGALEETLQGCNFETNFKDEFAYMDYNNIIDVGYDEAEDEPYYNWKNFDELSQEVLDFFLGTYFIWFEEGFDRMGNVSTRLFIKMEAKETGSEFIARYHTLMNKREPLAQALDNLQMATQKKDRALIEKAQLSEEEWDNFKKYNEELQEMGM